MMAIFKINKYSVLNSYSFEFYVYITTRETRAGDQKEMRNSITWTLPAKLHDNLVLCCKFSSSVSTCKYACYITVLSFSYNTAVNVKEFCVQTDKAN